MSIYLQPLDHSNDLHQGELFLAGVIVSRGSFVLLRCARTVLVAELIRGMDQLPRVLEDTINSSELKTDKRQKKPTNFSPRSTQIYYSASSTRLAHKHLRLP